MIFWKGKGILIFLYFIVSVVVLGLVYRALIEYRIFPSNLQFESFFGVVLICTGIWTRQTARDYYRDQFGRKQYVDIDNELYFIPMKTWGVILLFLGLGLIIWGGYQSVVT